MRLRLLRLRCLLVHYERRLRRGPLDLRWGFAPRCPGNGLCWTCCETFREFSCEQFAVQYPVTP